MAWGERDDFPRAILHVDGDAFFASCEIARNPALRGKPVVTGRERGIVSAASYEAKRRGVTRGMVLSEVRRVCPDAVVIPSDYETYSLYSSRMYEVVRRFTPVVEEYSIDECFAELTGMRRSLRMGYPEIAAAVKRELEADLGITFSVGLAPTKVLAKVGSKWKKPAGLTSIPMGEIAAFLRELPAEKLWGVGPATAAYLRARGVRSALDLAAKDTGWAEENLDAPYLAIWHELNGRAAMELETGPRAAYQSISKTKTFTPPSADHAFVRAQLSKNIENTCIKARRHGLAAREASIFLKTQSFSYASADVPLPCSTAAPQEVWRHAAVWFGRLFRPGTLYRATGVTLRRLAPAGSVQLDLFGALPRAGAEVAALEAVDAIDAKMGKHAIFLGSSLAALAVAGHVGARGDRPTRERALFPGETARRRLAIPYLGEAS